MPEVYKRETPETREEVVTSNTGDVQHQERVVEYTGLAQRQTAYRLRQFIWLIFGILEGLIAIRVILKFIAANPSNPFAYFVYRFTDLFLWPFFGLTWTPAAGGIVLELSSIIAMVVYALIAWLLVRVVWLLFYNNRPTADVEVIHRDHRL